ncbi:MAG: molybdenum cofactor guanylyltransferase [Candidatus Eremiobacteraeota bacterium]|nr:molybdenum cofactor guanylyltransferase [Candidatus Eremiobacteraeota bacterium]
MPVPSPVSIILLAGGEARRLPGKLGLHLGGEPLLLRTYRRLTDDRRRPCVVSIHTSLDPAIRSELHVPLIEDRYGRCGPLGGLLSAAEDLDGPLFFAAAGDLPFLQAAFIDRLEQHYVELCAAGGARPAALIPRRRDGSVEPLAALYETAQFVQGARNALQRGERKVTAALTYAMIAYLDLTGADEEMLMNINTPADWERVQA